MPLSVMLNALNSGPIEAQGVEVSYTLPAAAMLAGVTSSQGECIVDAGVVRYTLGALVSAGQAQVTLSLVPQSRGTLKHVARVVATTEDPMEGHGQIPRQAMSARAARRSAPSA